MGPGTREELNVEALYLNEVVFSSFAGFHEV
jgi:hypothetical protein